MDKFFTKFPNINYNGTVCKDVCRTVRLDPTSKKQVQLFHPYQIEAGLRPDHISEAYYNDSEMDWLIWLTNDLIDPYYNWYLSEQEFENFIVKKYGSIEAAVKKIKYYRNNWYKLEEIISVSEYNNSIAQVLKKYYTPQLNSYNKIISYKRKEEDWEINTNKIMSYNYSSNNSFYPGEIVDFKYLGNIVGGGEVVTSNTTSIIVQHISGNVSANSISTKIIIGEESKFSITVNNSIILQDNISKEEEIYWDQVTYYDCEHELNESRKNIYVINSEYSTDISEQIRLKLKE